MAHSHSLRSILLACRQAQFILLDHIYSIYTLFMCVFVCNLLSSFHSLYLFCLSRSCSCCACICELHQVRKRDLTKFWIEKKNCTKNFTDVNDDGDIQYTQYTQREFLPWFFAHVFMYSISVSMWVSRKREREVNIIYGFKAPAYECIWLK